MIVPTLDYEQSLWSSGLKYVAGVDEVGRGALAGPVVAAAVIFHPTHIPISGVRDSKTLSKLQKNQTQPLIIQQCLTYALGQASAQEIDTVGIVNATALAMQRALKQVTIVNHLLIDGKPFKNDQLLHTYPKTFIVDGDALVYSIAAASIIAKVYRDTLMTKLAKKFPQYNWDKNAGYGTKEHLAALNRYKSSPDHRNSFISQI